MLIMVGRHFHISYQEGESVEGCEGLGPSCWPGARGSARAAGAAGARGKRPRPRGTRVLQKGLAGIPLLRWARQEGPPGRSREAHRGGEALSWPWAPAAVSDEERTSGCLHGGR